MFYYIYEEKLLISKEEYPNHEEISEIEAEKYKGKILLLIS